MRVPAILVVAVACAAVASPTRAQDPAAFASELARVRALMDEGRWPTARQRLDRLLVDHADTAHARAIAQDLLEHVRRCAFHAAWKQPAFAELTSGRLHSYVESTGKIRITYDKAALADFTQQAGEITVWSHPALFDGPYTIRVRGPRYPTDGVRVFVAVDGGTGYDVTFGWKDERSYVSMSISRFADGRSRVVEMRQEPPIVTGRQFDVKVEVDERTIRAKVNDRTLLQTRNEGQTLGQFGIADAGWPNVEIEGKVQLAWLQGKLDAHLQRHLAEFERTWDPRAHAPAWLTAPGTPAPTKTDPAADPSRADPSRADPSRPGPEPAATGAGESGPAQVYPGRISPEHVPWLNAIMQLLNAGEYGEVIEQVGKADDRHAPPAARAWLIALAQLWRGRVDLAQPHAELVVAADPDFAPGRVLRADIWTELRRFDDATHEYRAAIARAPRDAAAYRGLALLLMQRGTLDAAEALLAEARRAHASSAELEALERTLRMARQGPAWPRTFSFESKNYVVTSDIDRDTCRDAAQILEQAYLLFQSQLTWIRPQAEPKRFRVFLFSGEAGYQAYVREIAGSARPHTAGLYTPILDQLLIWNVPDRDDMLRTVRHEGFHQYLDRIVDSPPVWLNEGLAEYYERAERTRGILDGGQLRPLHIRALRADLSAIVPLERFMRMAPAEFYADAELHYAQAWAIVQFLRKTTPERRRLFETLFEKLQSADPSLDAIGAAFAGIDLARLDREFREWVATLG